MALEVTARSAMKHRRMSGSDACFADVQAKGQDAAPEDVAELDAVGSGAIHREEWLAGLQLDRGIGAIGEKHDDLARLIFDFENRAEVMIGAKIRDPGQRTAHNVTPVDPAALQFQFLDSEEALHRI